MGRAWTITGCWQQNKVSLSSRVSQCWHRKHSGRDGSSSCHPGLLADWREALGSSTVLWSLIKLTATLQVNLEAGGKLCYLIATVGECECRKNKVIVAVKHLLKIIFLNYKSNYLFFIKKKAIERWI